jgi:Orsellinic acid/F9775 biosynthesis cluster protein D
MSTIKGNRFHPFQKTQGTQSPSNTVDTSVIDSELSDLRTSPLLDYLGYRFHTKHMVMICVACECAILLDNGLGHVKKKHNTPVPREQEELWNHTITEWNITSNPSIPCPKDRKPVELLKLHSDAICCNHCEYACLSMTTFSKHWSTNHKTSNLDRAERFHEGWVQTFYSHAPCVYFEVNVPIPNSTPLFDVYMRKEIPNYSPFDVIIPSAPREIPPLLYNTRWHEHLAEYLTDKPKRRLMFSLAHPSKFTKDPLWKLVWDYMNIVVDVSKESSMRVRCILTEYPR